MQISNQSDLNQVLRLTPEPCEYFDDLRVHRLLTADPAGYLSYVRQGLKEIATGRAQLDLPPKQIFSDVDTRGDFRVMPCVIRNSISVRKTVKLVGTNTVQQVVPDKITVGKAFAIDARENHISHTFDACVLSSARTGACAALAIELLAPSRRRVVVIGAGRVGYYAAFYTASLGAVAEVILYDTRGERARQTAALLARQIPDVRFEAAGRTQQGTGDVLILATTSRTPISNPRDDKAGLVVSLGADTDDQHELDPAWASAADLYVDTLDSARYGDLAAWQQSGLIKLDEVTDLLELLRSGVPGSAPRSRVFVSTGSALLDNLTIGYLLDNGS